jgi:hypothetical protein
MNFSRWAAPTTAMLAAALAAGAVSACGSSGSSNPGGSQPASNSGSNSASTTGVGGAATTTSASTTPAATTTASSSTASGSGGQSLTKPGSTLKLGQTADVVWNAGTGPNYTFAITVSSISPGSMSDFKDVSLSGVPKGATPTYVKLTIKNIGKKALKTSVGDPAYSMGANESDGLDGDLSLTGDFPPCPQADSPAEYVPGQTFSTCQIYMERGKVTQIGYDGSVSTIDTPILWSATG